MIRNVRTTVTKFIWRMLPACKEVTELISLELDRGLSFSEWMKVRLHILICTWCARYLKQIRSLHEELHKHEIPAEAPADVPDVIERLKKMVREHS